jgi:hypothetical protein
MMMSYCIYSFFLIIIWERWIVSLICHLLFIGFEDGGDYEMIVDGGWGFWNGGGFMDLSELIIYC